MVNISLFGFGPWAQNYVRVLDSIDGVNLKSILRLDPKKTPDHISDKYLVTSNIDRALKDTDAVIIATHLSSHKELALHCLSKKLPIILEKPVALNMNDAEIILNSFKNRNIPLLVNNIHLFSTAFEALKRDAHVLAPVRIYSESGFHLPVRNYSSLLDWGPHDVSMALSIFGGSPSEVEIIKSSNEYGDIFNVRLTLGKSTADLNIGSGFPTKRKLFIVEHESTRLVYDDMLNDKYSVNNKRVKIPQADSLKRMISVFLKCLSHGNIDWRFSTDFNLDIMNAITTE